MPLVLVGAAAAIGAALSRGLDTVEVRGGSMEPTLRPGDRLIVTRLGESPARVGDVVIARDPREPGRELVKRVGALASGGVELRGDNPRASTDGRTFGPLPAPAIEWRVLFRYWPPGRIGRVR